MQGFLKKEDVPKEIREDINKLVEFLRKKNDEQFHFQNIPKTREKKKIKKIVRKRYARIAK